MSYRGADTAMMQTVATGRGRISTISGGVRATARPAPAHPAREWIAGAIAFIVFWSLTYLLRQPGVADLGGRPFSLLGDFALEGAVLALSWLVLLVGACVALLRGTVMITSER